MNQAVHYHLEGTDLTDIRTTDRLERIINDR